MLDCPGSCALKQKNILRTWTKVGKPRDNMSMLLAVENETLMTALFKGFKFRYLRDLRCLDPPHFHKNAVKEWI